MWMPPMTIIKGPKREMPTHQYTKLNKMNIRPIWINNQEDNLKLVIKYLLK